MPVNRFDNYYLSYMPKKEALLPHLAKGMAEDLERRIVSGALAPYTKLPPQRELADYLDVNLSTITRAYRLCEQKGLIYGVSGSGTFVAPNARQKLEIFKRANQSCIELGLLEPFYDCNELVARAARAVINRQGAVRLFEYADPIGSQTQLAAARDWLARAGVCAPADRIIISSGSQNALTIALLSLFAPGDKIAADEFTYGNLKGLAGMLHMQLVPVAGDEAGMLPEELDRVARQQKLAGVYLMPDCANPTAITIPQVRRRALAGIIRAHALILIEDDGYSWLGFEDAASTCMEKPGESDQSRADDAEKDSAFTQTEEPDPGFCAAAQRMYEKDALTRMATLLPERTIYIHSTSKSLCAGLRVSFTVFPEAFRERMTAGILNVNLKSVALSAEIIVKIMRSGFADELMARKRRLAAERNRIFEEVFGMGNKKEERYVSPCSFFRFLPLPEGVNPEDFESLALRHGVHVLGSQRFQIASGSRKGYVRVALTSPRTGAELRKGLEILRALLDRQGA